MREDYGLGRYLIRIPLARYIYVKSLTDVPLSLCMMLSLPNSEASEILN